MRKGHGRKKILVVDDDQAVRDAIKMLLEDHYDVVEADNGENAIKLLPTEAVDMVLTDYRMGKGRMTGGELAQKIKEQAPSMPIVLVTGFHDEVPPGVMDAILLKPFTLEALLRVVQKLFDSPQKR